MSTHFSDTPHLKELVQAVLEARVVKINPLEFEHDFGRVVGTCDVVTTTTSDTIVYAIRKMRVEQGYVPFTKSRQAQPCSCITLSLAENTNDTFLLSSARIGTLGEPPFPQQEHATIDSKPYWSCHAFVWGSQEIEKGSEVSACPW